jgi:hypothetical protein
MFAPVPHDRRYSAQWWQAKEEEARMLRDREQRNREVAEQEAKARTNWRGPRWCEGSTLDSRSAQTGKEWLERSS